MDRRHAAMRFTSLPLSISVLALAIGLSAADTKAPAQARPKTTPIASSLPANAKLNSRALARHIDEAIDPRIRAEQVALSPRCDDAEFLRRVYLDITGHIPSVEKAVAFLDSREANKRTKLIEELLAGSEYGKHQADIWQSLLLPRTSDNRFMQFDKMTTWLEENFNANKPWDQMTRAIVTAEGDMDKNGAVLYYLANGTPDKVTDNASRMFLGVQLQCTQCHNHPFTNWKQDEYWGMAAFFTKVRLEGNPRQVARQGGTVRVNEGGKGRQVRLPISAKRVPPKFFQGEQPKLSAGDAYRPVLAEWMTSPKNPYFSKAMVNRTWAQFFGRGIVNPVDDMHDGNQPSHPQLLADLSSQFASNGFDVKYLIRAICNSQAYQRTSKPSSGNRDAGPELFSHMAVKVMTPEQLFDSLAQVLARLPRRISRAGKARPPLASASTRARSSSTSSRATRTPIRPNTRPASRKCCV